MIATWATIVALVGLLVVSLAMIISLTEGLRRHRVGVTVLACWAVTALVFFGLKGFGEPMPKWLYMPWLWPVGVMCGTWALWDVSRLARLYGTSTLMTAAEIARGFLHSPTADGAVWASWAHGLPSAAWLKGRGGIMVAINRHYERAYGKPANSYVGARDGHMWPDAVASEFAGNDQTVFECGAPIVVREPAPTWSDAGRTTMILKFPVRDQRGQVVGVGGIELAYPTQHDDRK